jgi:DNA-directed RNA polymerase subunit RPC12/RpoP
MDEQTITCEGCGSKWVVIGVGNQIVARLVECPLCSEKEVDAVE